MYVDKLVTLKIEILQKVQTVIFQRFQSFTKSAKFTWLTVVRMMNSTCNVTSSRRYTNGICIVSSVLRYKIYHSMLGFVEITKLHRLHHHSIHYHFDFCLVEW